MMCSNTAFTLQRYEKKTTNANFNDSKVKSIKLKTHYDGFGLYIALRADSC